MFLSTYEQQYIRVLSKIYNEGFADGVNERTGHSTKRIQHAIIRVDVESEFPILKSKFVAAKSAQMEIEGIWKERSNNIKYLKPKIWDSWADEDGGIGKAYGYQMDKAINIYTDPVHKTPESFRTYDNQAEFIIEYLREFPNGRWGVATLWNVGDLAHMNLVPCVHTSTWNLDGGRLNCLLDQRSGDMPYGVPFNTTQYAQLMLMIARDLGVKPGLLTHVIADAHIYDTQMEGVQKQLCNYSCLQALYNMDENYAEKAATNRAKLSDDLCAKDVLDRAKSVLDSTPKFSINTENTDFFSYDAESCSMEDYSYMEKLDFGDVVV